jgi:hypothetical protein
LQQQEESDFGSFCALAVDGVVDGFVAVVDLSSQHEGVSCAFVSGFV